MPLTLKTVGSWSRGYRLALTDLADCAGEWIGPKTQQNVLFAT